MSHVFLAAGDLAMDRDDYDASFAATRAVLRSADIVFGQLETSFAESGVRLPQARHAVLARPEGAAALGRAGFDCISMASNHSVLNTRDLSSTFTFANRCRSSATSQFYRSERSSNLRSDPTTSAFAS